MTAQKEYALADGGSTVLKFRGHPRYDAFRVENESGSSVDVNVYVSKDDELDEVSTGDADAVQVDSTTGLGTGSNYGTEVSARTVLVEVSDNTAGDGDPAGTVYAHDASDAAENAAAFANR